MVNNVAAAETAGRRGREGTTRVATNPRATGSASGHEAALLRANSDKRRQPKTSERIARVLASRIVDNHLEPNGR